MLTTLTFHHALIPFTIMKGQYKTGWGYEETHLCFSTIPSWFTIASIYHYGKSSII